MDSTEAKIAGMICLGIGSLGVGLAPAWFSAHSAQWPLLLSCLLCAGGGVLFSTTLIHILPELREITNYSELLLCAGFFLLYFIDEIVHYFWSDNGRHVPRGSQNNPLHSHGHSHHVRTLSLTKSKNYGSVVENGTHDIYGRQYPYNPVLSRGSSRSDIYEVENRTAAGPASSHNCHVSHTEPCNDPPIGQLGLLVALSLHAVLEGIAIGVEEKASKVWLLVGAVASHKLVVGFCLGCELSSGPMNSACKHFTAIIIFTMGSVGGIGIGMIATNVSNDWNQMAQPIMQGFAAGTLLYVTVCEVLPRERAKWHNQTECPAASLIQLLSMATGFAIMTLITQYLDFDRP